MTLIESLTLFSPADWAAVGFLVFAWFVSTRLIEHPPKRFPSTSALMAGYRREWMVAFVHRNPRIFDSQIVGQLRQGTAFFASGSMIAIGGGFALLGNAERLRGVAQDLTQSADPVVVWEIKLILMLLFAANAFLKFVWSHRLFGYCAVLMAAVPNDPDDPVAMPRARKAGEINIFAARGYNRGLRSVYFGIASAAWLIGPAALLVATVFTVGVILRREFASQSRAILLEQEPGQA
ncbi:DUF599 domain-containing protein [Thetidibacter halocola]|uniref:DUF599 domain-containing protein n=1 Tax=Thetidibacter halocola TaxID=2827239 RepID=A0A8J7WHI8_9RHOB|nr:DUF599 domain-containing protein [Thetidibacter halocola]MBS0125766.1 DUF599 domain-containing protein [Thetidibacter halocola]